METKEDNQKIVDALYIVIDEFEENPITNFKANDTMLEILSERVEIIMNRWSQPFLSLFNYNLFGGDAYELN